MGTTAFLGIRKGLLWGSFSPYCSRFRGEEGFSLHIDLKVQGSSGLRLMANMGLWSRVVSLFSGV